MQKTITSLEAEGEHGGVDQNGEKSVLAKKSTVTRARIEKRQSGMHGSSGHVGGCLVHERKKNVRGFPIKRGSIQKQGVEKVTCPCKIQNKEKKDFIMGTQGDRK